MISKIEESAQSRLLESADLAPTDICCEERGGILTLRGYVPTYFLKQLAGTLVADLDRVTAVVNDIEVACPLRLVAVRRMEAAR